MPIIVFACKSNSCRSQMAEGWARDWLQKKKDDVDIKLKHNVNNSNSNNDNNDNNNSNNNEENIKQQLSILENTIITSVALDASAVFEEEKTSPTTHTTSSLDMCTRSTTQSSVSSNNNNSNSNNNNHSSLKRKNIKSKAIEAMANDGVDIKSYIPKTLHEILPFISNNNDHDHSASSSSSNTEEQLFPEHKQAEEEESLSFNDDININKPVDKLIVLCSCGDELKHKIVRRSKSVEEWNIDPPTTAAKNGEGDAAYRRVSLEVKNEVNILMESLIGDALH